MEDIIDFIITMFKLGLVGFGGGNSMIPLLQHELVTIHELITIEEFQTYLGLANMLPGPTISTFTFIMGFHLYGLWVPFVAMLVFVLPSSLALIVFGKLYKKHKDSDRIFGLLTAIKAVVIILIASVAIKMIPNTYFHEDLFTSLSMVLISVLTILSYKFKIHPIFPIAFAMLYGGFLL